MQRTMQELQDERLKRETWILFFIFVLLLVVSNQLSRVFIVIVIDDGPHILFFFLDQFFRQTCISFFKDVNRTTASEYLLTWQVVCFTSKSM